MKHIRILGILVCLFPSLVWSQVNQPGDVYTISYKRGVKGEPIANVGLQAGINESRSGKSGEFLIPVKVDKDKTFKFTNIYKEGYELITPSIDELSSKRFPFNPSTKITVVMANLDRLYKARREIEQSVRKTKEAEIAGREAEITAKQIEIEQLKEENKSVQVLTEQLKQMSDELQKHKNAYYSSDELIRKEAERLSRIDYQSIDSIQAVIIDLLKEGCGEEVVRIAKAQFPHEWWAQIMNDPGSIKRDIEQKQQLLAHTAEQLKNMADGYATNYKIDSAAYYLRKRVEMDVDNYQYAMDCGRFVHGYLASYDEALKLYNTCLNIAKKQEGEASAIVATCYNNIGSVYDAQGDYPMALEYYSKALDVFTKLNELRNEKNNMAISYTNIGIIGKTKCPFYLKQNVHILPEILRNKKYSFGVNHRMLW